MDLRKGTAIALAIIALISFGFTAKIVMAQDSSVAIAPLCGAYPTGESTIPGIFHAAEATPSDGYSCSDPGPTADIEVSDDLGGCQTPGWRSDGPGTMCYFVDDTAGCVDGMVIVDGSCVWGYQDGGHGPQMPTDTPSAQVGDKENISESTPEILSQSSNEVADDNVLTTTVVALPNTGAGSPSKSAWPMVSLGASLLALIMSLIFASSRHMAEKQGMK